MFGLRVTLAPSAAGLLAGIMLAGAYAPVDAGPLAFISLVPLAIVCAREAPAAAARSGFVAGIAFFAVLLSWIGRFGFLAWAALVLVQAAWIALAAALSAVGARRLPGVWKFLAFGVAWVAVEYLRGRWPLGGFTWGGLGYSQHNNRFVLPLAAYTGVWGVSFLVATVNAAVAQSLRKLIAERDWAAAALGTTGAVLLTFLPVMFPVDAPAAAYARIGVVQGNVPTLNSSPHADDATVVKNHLAATRKLGEGPLSLVVWPESAVDEDPFRRPEFLKSIQDATDSAKAPLLAGMKLDAPAGRFANASVMFASDGQRLKTYRKMHLVPFGEYVPLRGLLGWIPQLRQIPTDGIAGKTPTVFNIPEGSFSSVICFESTFPALVRKSVVQGARLLIVSTNNSSYRRSAASDQHVAFSQLRAAEHGMWVVHAALSGISAVVAPDGSVTERTGLFEEAVLTPTVRFSASTTLYARAGDWMPLAAIAAMAVLLFGIPSTNRDVF